MKNFIIAIDYAFVYHSFQSIYKTNDSNVIEEKVCEAISALERYVKNMIPGDRVHIAGKAAYVLRDEVYGNPENTLPSKANIIVKRVNESRKCKTKEMKDMNQSRVDDVVLMNDVIHVMNNKNIQGVILVSNDNDFYELATKVRRGAKNFWLASVDYKKNDVNFKPGYLIKNYSDKCLPLLDIVNGIDSDIDREDEVIETKELDVSSLDIYSNGRLITSYPLDRSVISIGRRSVRMRHLPNIDLSEYDNSKSISRMHASVYKSGLKLMFYIDDKCSAPTWDGATLKRAGEQFQIKPNHPIILGKQKKFVLVYRER